MLRTSRVKNGSSIANSQPPIPPKPKTQRAPHLSAIRSGTRTTTAEGRTTGRFSRSVDSVMDKENATGKSNRKSLGSSLRKVGVRRPSKSVQERLSQSDTADLNDLYEIVHKAVSARPKGGKPEGLGLLTPPFLAAVSKLSASALTPAKFQSLVLAEINRASPVVPVRRVAAVLEGGENAAAFFEYLAEGSETLSVRRVLDFLHSLDYTSVFPHSQSDRELRLEMVRQVQTREDFFLMRFVEFVSHLHAAPGCVLLTEHPGALMEQAEDSATRLRTSSMVDMSSMHSLGSLASETERAAVGIVPVLVVTDELFNTVHASDIEEKGRCIADKENAPVCQPKAQHESARDQQLRRMFQSFDTENTGVIQRSAALEGMSVLAEQVAADPEKSSILSLLVRALESLDESVDYETFATTVYHVDAVWNGTEPQEVH